MKMTNLFLCFVLALAFTVTAEQQTERERIYKRTVEKEDTSFRRYVRYSNQLRSMKKGLIAAEKRLAEGKYKTPAWYLFQETLPQKVERLKEEIVEVEAKIADALKKNAKLVKSQDADFAAIK